MRTILCYGDSNTWGYVPGSGDRFAPDHRWPGVLRAGLGSSYHVIEEGLNGRTTVWDDPIEGHKNGMTYLLPCLESHRPVNLVVLMLGSNDLKTRFSLAASDVAAGVACLSRAVLVSHCGPAIPENSETAPQLLLLSPPPPSGITDFADMFQGAEAKGQRLSSHYRAVAEELGCAFLDTGTVVSVSPIDGIHLDLQGHRRLGSAVADRVSAIFDA